MHQGVLGLAATIALWSPPTRAAEPPVAGSAPQRAERFDNSRFAWSRCAEAAGPIKGLECTRPRPARVLLLSLGALAGGVAAGMLFALGDRLALRRPGDRARGNRRPRRGRRPGRGRRGPAARRRSNTLRSRAPGDRRSGLRVFSAPLLDERAGHSAALHFAPTWRFADGSRVLAENEHARLRTATGDEARFFAAGSRDADTWDATGLLLARSDGSIDARVAGLGAFTLALSRNGDGPDAITVHLTNVDSGASVTVGPVGDALGSASPDPGQTTRPLDVSLTADEPVLIDATLDCPSRYRIAVVSDIQTNPDQFRRITEVMREEWRTSAGTGEPLVGLVVPGDVTEASRDEELQIVAEILAGLPFGIAVTSHDRSRHGCPNCSMPATQNFSLLGMHHPPYAGWTGAGWSLEDQAAHLLAEAALAGVDVVLAGHSHQLAGFPDVPVACVDICESISGTGGARRRRSPSRGTGTSGWPSTRHQGPRASRRASWRYRRPGTRSRQAKSRASAGATELVGPGLALNQAHFPKSRMIEGDKAPVGARFGRAAEAWAPQRGAFVKGPLKIWGPQPSAWA